MRSGPLMAVAMSRRSRCWRAHGDWRRWGLLVNAHVGADPRGGVDERRVGGRSFAMDRRGGRGWAAECLIDTMNRASPLRTAAFIVSSASLNTTSPLRMVSWIRQQLLQVLLSFNSFCRILRKLLTSAWRWRSLLAQPRLISSATPVPLSPHVEGFSAELITDNPQLGILAVFDAGWCINCVKGNVSGLADRIAVMTIEQHIRPLPHLAAGGQAMSLLCACSPGELAHPSSGRGVVRPWWSGQASPLSIRTPVPEPWVRQLPWRACARSDNGFVPPAASAAARRPYVLLDGHHRYTICKQKHSL